MRDQAAMVREAVKWDYELRYPEQAALVVERALAIAESDPAAPVYLSLPREVLAETAPSVPPLETRQQPVKAGAPRSEAVAKAAELLCRAAQPVIVAQRLSARALHAGGDTSPPWLAEADVVVTVDTTVPWLIDAKNSGWDAMVIAIGADPLFQRLPVRSFPVDLALAGDPALALSALVDALSALRLDEAAIARRREGVTRRNLERREAARRKAEQGAGSPMNAAWVSRCLSDAKDEAAVVLNELGCDPSVMRFTEPNTYFSAAHSGGLGWALPAALGFQLADRERLVIACVGDGSYIFANPTACHLTAMAQKLPVLVVVFNNGVWQAVRRATIAMYPDGEAAKSNAMPFTLLSPAPDYAALSRAHGCFGEKVLDGAALPGAIGRALKAIREERLPALLDVYVSPT
jgi:acetolactate synthase-1/2/3 large subunit